MSKISPKCLQVLLAKQDRGPFVTKTNSDIKTQKWTRATFILMKYKVVPSHGSGTKCLMAFGYCFSQTYSHVCFICLSQSCKAVKIESQNNSKKKLGLKNTQLLKKKTQFDSLKAFFLISIFFSTFICSSTIRQKTAKVIDEMMSTSRPHAQPSLCTSFMTLQFHDSLPCSLTTETHFLLLP